MMQPETNLRPCAHCNEILIPQRGMWVQINRYGKRPKVVFVHRNQNKCTSREWAEHQRRIDG